MRNLVAIDVALWAAFTLWIWDMLPVESAFDPDLLTLFIWQAALLVWLVWALRLNRLRSADLLVPHPDPESVLCHLPLAILAVCIGTATTYLVNYPWSFIDADDVTAVVTATMQLGYTPLQEGLSIVMSIAIAPVLEELVFRGLVLHRLARRWGTRTAIVVSSILFGLFHVDVPGAIVTGAMLALAYLKTRTLAVPIAIHIAHNVLILALERLGIARWSESFDATRLQETVWIGALCFIVAAIWLRRLFEEARDGIANGPPLLADERASSATVQGG